MASLYLDESGQFKKSKRNRSIIGGFFIKNNNLNPTELKNFFSKFNLGIKVFHGKEIPSPTLSKIINELIDFCNKKEIIPVIFIPTHRFHVINDTKTYLNVLCDGVISFIKNYSNIFQNINKLEIKIEHRSGLNSKEYDNRLKESIEKAISLSSLYNRDIEFECDIGNKEDCFLQLADAIVHTFYRLDVDSYSTRDEFDKNVRRKFEKWIEPYKIYLYSQPTDVKIKDFLKNELFELALKDLLNYHRVDKSVRDLIPQVAEQLCTINIFYLNSTLLSLFAGYYYAINEKRILQQIEKDILFIIEEFLPLLEAKLPCYGKQKEDIHWAYTYCYMLLLTLYNHKGDVQKFEQKYNQAQGFINSTPFDLDSLNYRLRIRVLYGVHLTNLFAFEQCFNEMKLLEKKVSDACAFLNESDDNVAVQPRILGEIAGTKLQAKMYHTLVKGGSWDDVRKISDEVIKSFVQSEDVRRQYQYRAQIETYAKNYNEAKQYLAKGCGIEYESDKQLLEYIVSKSLKFPLLHFLRIYYVDLMNNNIEKVKTYYEIVTSVFGKYTSNVDKIFESRAYPLHSIYHYLMVIWRLFNSNNSVKQANEFYKTALKLCKKDYNMTIMMIQLAIKADYIWAVSLCDTNEIESLQKDFNATLDKVLNISSQTPLHSYLLYIRERYTTTPAEKWNSLWYMIPF
ncbi:MAG: DUF3800 domain-containing protein [Spirochaetes bacterium]|nr:DUF3800 domain-containing protein [Spirochaetota bacterium]